MNPSPASEQQRAWDLVVHLLGAGPSPQGPIDARLLHELTSWHGMEATLGDGELVHDERIAPTMREAWRQASLFALSESVWRLEATRRMLRALAPLPVILFKGFAYAELIFPSPAERVMGDVDMLIEPAQMAEAAQRLTAAGFEAQQRVDLEHPCSFEWTFSKGNLALDVHRGVSFPARLRVATADLFARAIRWDDLGSNARLLGPADAVLVHALQAPLAEFSPVMAPAMGAWDLRLLLRRDGPFWGKVASPPLDRALVRGLAGEWRASRSLYAALRWVGRLFPDSVASMEGLMPELPARVAGRIDGRIVARACPPGLERPSTAERMVRRWILVPPRDRLAVMRQMVERRVFGVGRPVRVAH
jgi:hypothetical protein